MSFHYWGKASTGITVSILYHDKSMPRIRQLENSNWIDLYSAEERRYKKGDYFMLSLGVSIKLPPGKEGLLVPRSSTFKKYGVLQTNGVGIIDTSYCGNSDIWKLPLYALRDGVIGKYERVCQFRLLDSMGTLNLKEVGSLDDPSRGGFGSTGVY